MSAELAKLFLDRPRYLLIAGAVGLAMMYAPEPMRSHLHLRELTDKYGIWIGPWTFTVPREVFEELGRNPLLFPPQLTETPGYADLLSNFAQSQGIEFLDLPVARRLHW